MPFTLTHVLAILPIATVRRSPLPFSALVIGSMIPDFPLFVPLSPDYRTTHSIPGVLTACLPLGLAWFLGFQLLMKQPLFTLLPLPIQRRCLPYAKPCVEASFRFLAFASAAVMVGACTHIFWDSFTHQGRWGTQIFSSLNETAMTVNGFAIKGSKLLQYGCTALGLPCLVILLARWLRRQTPGSLEGYPSLSVSMKAVVYLVIASVAASAAIVVWRQEDISAYDRVGRSITTAGLAVLIAVMAYCVTFQAVARKSRKGDILLF